MSGPSPLTLFRRLAIAEAVTWALLLAGMFLKYVTQTTELGVRVFGMVHGVVFIAYCLTTVLVAVDQRWRPGRLVLGLVSSVPPFMTVWFDRYAEARGALGTEWRLLHGDPASATDRPVAWLLRNPLRGVLAGLVAVAALTGVALLVGPPAG
ncbi:MAG: rane protein [Nocardioides sp.]|nr:rane protein [Nocardioides sp.]